MLLVKALDRLTTILERFDVVYGNLARAAVRLRVKADLLAFDQDPDTSALQGCRMDKNVLAAVVRLDETVTLLVVVEFHGTVRHGISFYSPIK